MVQKVGDKRYWEQWAADVAKIAQRYIERINRLIAVPGLHKQAFDEFLSGLQKNINPSVSAGEVVEMLAQHLITKPVFEALFENYSFVQSNPVSRSLQVLVDLMEEQAMDKDTVVLSRFYESVKMRVSGIDNSEGRQRIIVELYDKFFKTAFPLTVERLGIVYTPVEVVDFINRSVADVLKEHFGRSLSDENVHVLDPFTGTGTFIVRMIESGLIAPEALPRKYAHELHANEIVLLAYYIASINIENAYHATQGENAAYTPFNGICLTDTFQLGETDDTNWLYTPALAQNSERVQAQQRTPIQVIIGNPPYSVGQKSANDNAQNLSYPKLEKRIANTYGLQSNATLQRNIYDSYIKAFRWASDRLPKSQNGVIAFISNSGWLDGNAMDGFRKCLEKEFSNVYIFNLRGSLRGKKGDHLKKEGENIFNIMTGVAITILIKKYTDNKNTTIKYYQVDDYMSKKEKLYILSKIGSIFNNEIKWIDIHPNSYGDWLTHRNDIFKSFIPLGDKDNKNNKQTFFAPYYSNGLVTSRDAWCWNFSINKIKKNISKSIDFYNSEVSRVKNIINNNIVDVINTDKKNFSWDRKQRKDILIGKQYSFSIKSIRFGLYRPFQKSYCYFNRDMNNCVYKLPCIFPTSKHKNIIICIPGTGSVKGFSVHISNLIRDFDTYGGTQCFPLYYYEKKSIYQPTLFDDGNEEYTRKDGITNFILERCRENYGPKVTKEDIFYYVYGLLHSPDYRNTFVADLKKMLPRLPLVEKPADFWAFSKAGRALADMHLNYETQPACPDVVVTGAEHGNFHVTKMHFPKKDDKTTLEYNPWITLSHIPLEAYEYVVNGRSAVEWIVERYQIKTDKASGITNDPNDWAQEQGKPRYILDLLLSVITVSLETMKIVKGLPKLEIATEKPKD